MLQIFYIMEDFWAHINQLYARTCNEVALRATKFLAYACLPHTAGYAAGSAPSRQLPALGSCKELGAYQAAPILAAIVIVTSACDGLSQVLVIVCHNGL